MHLNHLNLTVPNPIETQAFLAKHFQMKPMGKPNSTISFLTDEQGMILSLSHMKLGGESEVRYPATFHIGFGQETEEQVNEIHRRLVADGVDAPAPSRQHGSWTFYFAAPGGFTIEVLC